MSARSLASFAVVAALASGCAQPNVEPAESAGANMRGVEAAEWQGVYQGPYHIYLAIERHGERASGTWRSMGGRRGQLWGEVSGNVLHFAWLERDTQSPGEWSGRGTLVLSKTSSDRPAELHGEWGFGRSDSGRQWWAIKRPEVPVALAESRLIDRGAGSRDDPQDSDDLCVGGCGDVGGDDFN